MTTIELKPVKSSQIAAIGYSPETNTLRIQFLDWKEKKPSAFAYDYANVTADEFAKFEAAESKGSYFGMKIKPFKDKYPYTKVTLAQG